MVQVCDPPRRGRADDGSRCRRRLRFILFWAIVAWIAYYFFTGGYWDYIHTCYNDGPLKCTARVIKDLVIFAFIEGWKLVKVAFKCIFSFMPGVSCPLTDRRMLEELSTGLLDPNCTAGVGQCLQYASWACQAYCPTMPGFVPVGPP